MPTNPQLDRGITYSQFFAEIRKSPDLANLTKWGKLFLVSYLVLQVTGACGGLIDVVDSAPEDNQPPLDDGAGDDTPDPDISPSEEPTATQQIPAAIRTPESPISLPAPKDIQTTLLHAFPGSIQVIAEFDDFPTGSDADTPGEYPEVDAELRAHALVPVLAMDADAGSAFAHLSPDGVAHVSPLGQVSDFETGTALKLEGQVSEQGLAHYVSEDGAIEQWGIMAIDCPEGKVCRQVVSYGAEDAGVTYFVISDEATGKVEKFMPVLFDSEPRLNEDGKWVVDGDVIEPESADGRWDEVTVGERAIYQTNPLVVDDESVVEEDQRGYGFMVDGAVEWAAVEEFARDPDIGLYVLNDEGEVFVYDEAARVWERASAVSGDKVVGGAELFKAGDRQFVQMDGKLELVDSVESKDGVTTITLDDGREFKWVEAEDGGDEWVEDLFRLPNGVGLEFDESDTDDSDGQRVKSLVPPENLTYKEALDWTERNNPETYGFEAGDTQWVYKDGKLILQDAADPAIEIAEMGNRELVWDWSKMVDEDGESVILKEGKLWEMSGGFPIEFDQATKSFNQLTSSLMTDGFFEGSRKTGNFSWSQVVSKDGSQGVVLKFYIPGKTEAESAGITSGYVCFWGIDDQNRPKARWFYVENFDEELK